MNSFLKKVIGDKQAWNKMEARAKALPHDYQVVYGEIKDYMWNLWRFSTSSGNETESMAKLEDVLQLFEANAKDGKTALEVTGKDVAAFCDDLFNATESWREKMNARVARKIGE